MPLDPILTELTTASPIILSTDFINKITGNGYITFYLCKSILVGGQTSFLTTNIVDSLPLKTNTTNTEVVTTNYDSTFLLQATIEGECTVQFTTTNPASSNLDVTVTILHVDLSAVETSIGSAVTENISATGDRRDILIITLTKKNFAVGEKLRIKVRFGKNGSNSAQIYHDPSSSLTKTDVEGRTIGTDFKVFIPFNTQD